MISEDDRKYLLLKLTNRLSGLDARVALSTVLPAPCMGQIRYLQYPTEYAVEALTVCIKDRWNNEPPWLLKLLELLAKDPEIKLIEARISTKPSGPNPELAQLLANDSPFLDRTVLRQKSTALAAPVTAKPVLLVSGPSKCGKSYTKEYVQHLRLSGANFEYCRVELTEENIRTCGPEQLASDMLTNMGVEVAKLGPSFLLSDTNSERWPLVLAGRVLSTGKSLGKRFWVLLDGFGVANVRQDTRKLIVALAQTIVENSTYSDSFRLILPGFDRTTLPVKSGVDVEAVVPTGDSDVSRCVAEIFDRLSTPLTPTDLEPVVTRILKDLPQDETRMEELNGRLSDLIAELREGAHA